MDRRSLLARNGAKRASIACAICAALFLSGHDLGFACIWDRDTLAMEKARFPEAADVVIGKFPRHSREYYEWRKKRSESTIAKDPKAAAAYDDLAVAQHKLGDQKAAIDTMKRKEAQIPGLYETYSNLGTFYIYAGDLMEAHHWIESALSVNANAHFGREKYQKWLIEWLQEGKPDVVDEAAARVAKMNVPFSGFAKFLVDKLGYAGRAEDWKDGRGEAVRAIVGMMRFADYDNPVLLEAMADVLKVGTFDENASNLAAEALLLASRRSKSDQEKQRLFKKMYAAGATQDEFYPGKVKKALDAGLAEGAALNALVRADEMAWMAKGKDAAAEFDKRYLPPQSR